ncbi:MAG: 50S ribosomal protein L6 [Nanopusillaceae archaeon]
MRPYIVIEKVDVPDNVKVSIEKNVIKVEGPKGKKERMINNRNIIIEKKDNQVIFKAYFPSKKVLKDLYTMIAHLKNDIHGVVNGYRYKLKAVYIHYPIKLKLDKNKLVIENFMGGKNPIVIEIPEGVKASINENEIILEGYDLEKLGNLAGLIENSVRLRDKDLRKFQDGIYIVEKP